ncbi:DUF2975 domain-containing protein [Nocardiopsis sp. B62]|uniref:DUF2975 domain-containing protein n=1 Tax=Nocardiopsis sp. B62 TaxID=2824874 RepID=UPI001B372303|nr:DUF2975 domain-containing protein [Nocardiopsis sp. B62]MBQ1082783.1 DUF2975 domain-containing protein [Nocardiopsis sp. B62]
MHRYLTPILRLAIIGAILVGLFGQIVVIPGAIADEAAHFPPYERIVVPYTILGILGVACVQVALGATWMLLGMMGRDALFSTRAFLWVDLIIGASLAGALLTAGVTAHLALTDMPFANGNMEAVAALGAAFLTTAMGTAFAMVVVLMRGLLRKATHLQAEMAGVV